MVNRVFDKIERNTKEQILFLQKLVQTNSSNPFSSDNSNPKEPIEKEVALIIADKLTEIGLKPEFHGVSAERPNIITYLRGSHSNAPSLILNGHMDTIVPPASYSIDPYSGLIQGKKLYGVGSLDMKSSLSVYIYATKAILQSGLDLIGKLILTFVVDEEPGACSEFGTRYLVDKDLKATSAIIGEPGCSKIAIGHRGLYRFKIITLGESVHTGTLDWEEKKKGENAISNMVEVINVLRDLAIPYKQSSSFPNRRPVFTYPTLIRGGQNINTVPDRCETYGDVRLLPSNSRTQIKALIVQAIQDLKDKKGIQCELTDLLFIPSVAISAQERIVRILSKNVKTVMKIDPTIEGSGPANDAWMFIQRGIPCVCGFGCYGEGIHGRNEWVDLESLINVTKVYAKTIIDYLGVI